MRDCVKLEASRKKRIVDGVVVLDLSCSGLWRIFAKERFWKKGRSYKRVSSCVQFVVALIKVFPRKPAFSFLRVRSCFRSFANGLWTRQYNIRHVIRNKLIKRNSIHFRDSVSRVNATWKKQLTVTRYYICYVQNEVLQGALSRIKLFLRSESRGYTHIRRFFLNSRCRNRKIMDGLTY